MRVITAVEQYKPEAGDISVFLGGGITNCRDWQKEVINKLSANSDLKNLVIFNPRRENFPIHDPNASNEQIEWEFKYLMESDIFSMFFCQDTNSDQPICMYELGRYIPIKNNQNKPIIITSEPGYKRITDVEIQSKLALNNKMFEINTDINQHVNSIIDKYNQLTQTHKPQSSLFFSKKDSEKFINVGKGIITESKTLLNLNMINFKNIKHTGLIFENKTFSNCMFNNSSLYSIKYKNCNLINCNFNHSNLKDVIFENCEFGYTSFIGTKTDKNSFINCKFVCCEQQSNINKLTFDYIENIISQDKRFSKIEQDVYNINIIEYHSTLNVVIMKNSEVGEGNCNICVYITPKEDPIKQLTPLFITYDFDQISEMFKYGDFCDNLISDILNSIDLKYKPLIKNCIDQLTKITGD